MPAEDTPFGAPQPVTKQRNRRNNRDPLSKLRKGGEVGGGVRILSQADIEAQRVAEFHGPDWNLFKHELAAFLTMNVANDFVRVFVVTPEMKRREWERHRDFHKKRIEQSAPVLDEGQRRTLDQQLEGEIAFFREMLLKQATPFMALHSAIDEVTETARKFLGVENKVQIVSEIANKMDQGLTDILVVQAIKQIALKWGIDDDHTLQLLHKHVFDKEPPTAIVPAFPSPRRR